MLRRLYKWCIDAADKPHATWLMGIISFVESSFFPVPPDAMLIPMSLARPDRAWFYASVCTLTSVAGGLLGYFIGAVLYDSIGQWVISLYGLGGKAEAFREAYAYWGTWIILIKGVTPIPYKLVTIASGLAGVGFPLFMLYSAVTRSIRYVVIEAMLVHFFGERAQALLEKYLELALVTFLIVLVLGFVALRYL